MSIVILHTEKSYLSVLWWQSFLRALLSLGLHYLCDCNIRISILFVYYNTCTTSILYVTLIWRGQSIKINWIAVLCLLDVCKVQDKYIYPWYQDINQVNYSDNKDTTIIVINKIFVLQIFKTIQNIYQQALYM